MAEKIHTAGKHVTWRAYFATLMSRFRRSDDGVTAIEFGIVAAPFFAVLLATFETGLIFVTMQVLDLGVLESARLIRTGQVKHISKDAFKTTLCANLPVLIDCTKVSIDVRSFTNFAATAAPPPSAIDDDGNFDDSAFTFVDTPPSTIVVVRVFYIWNTIFPNFGLGAGALANGDRLLVSTSTFRNEPFPWP